ncbi:MAG: OsmC family protein [Candidatus Thorarchaeota archaeon]|nr:OsmC family protein [Candidatus Thorarchaeota archaeon]
MSEEPRVFEQHVRWTEEKFGEVTAAGMPAIRTGGQIQTGATRYHTPEDLLVAAVATCFMNSFLAFIEKMHIEVKSLEVVGRGHLERVDRSYEITKVFLNVRVVIESEELRPKIERALELGGKYCFVGNSLKGTVEHTHEIVVS